MKACGRAARAPAPMEGVEEQVVEKYPNRDLTHHAHPGRLPRAVGQHLRGGRGEAVGERARGRGSWRGMGGEGAGVENMVDRRGAAATKKAEAAATRMSACLRAGG
eukprot:scaffold23186_cov112-Isochrysis_galbana.AAC.3